MRNATGLIDKVRAVFEARKEEAIGNAELFRSLGLSEPHLTGERDAVRDSVKYLVRCGYLDRKGSHASVQYRFSGRGMPRPRKSLEERRLRQNERQRQYRAERAQAAPVRKKPAPVATTAPAVRFGRQAGMAPAPPFGHQAQDVTGETVEQFLARGGRVQRLTAHWEQAA